MCSIFFVLSQLHLIWFTARGLDVLDSQSICLFDFRVIRSESAFLTDRRIPRTCDIRSFPAQPVFFDMFCGQHLGAFVVLGQPMFVAVHILAIIAGVNGRPVQDFTAGAAEFCHSITSIWPVRCPRISYTVAKYNKSCTLFFVHLFSSNISKHGQYKGSSQDMVVLASTYTSSLIQSLNVS